MTVVLHFAVLIAMVPLAVLVGLRYRPRLWSAKVVLVRVSSGLLAALAVAGFSFAPFMCRCGAGNNPVRQAFAAGLSALLCCVLVDTVKARTISVCATLIVGVALSAHFSRLALPPNSYECRFTGDPYFIRNSCAVSAEARTVWHTPVTGLYVVRKNPE